MLTKSRGRVAAFNVISRLHYGPYVFIGIAVEPDVRSC